MLKCVLFKTSYFKKQTKLVIPFLRLHFVLVISAADVNYYYYMKVEYQFRMNAPQKAHFAALHC